MTPEPSAWAVERARELTQHICASCRKRYPDHVAFCDESRSHGQSHNWQPMVDVVAVALELDALATERDGTVEALRAALVGVAYRGGNCWCWEARGDDHNRECLVVSAALALTPDSLRARGEAREICQRGCPIEGTHSCLKPRGHTGLCADNWHDWDAMTGRANG